MKLTESVAPPSNPDALLTITEAMSALRIGRTHFYNLRRRGEIKTLQLGNRTLVPQREISRIIDEALGRRATPSTPPRLSRT